MEGERVTLGWGLVHQLVAPPVPVSGNHLELVVGAVTPSEYPAFQSRIGRFISLYSPNPN